MRKLLMFVLLVFWSWPVSAQDALWSRTYGGGSADWGWSVQQTADSGYIVAGVTESFGAGGEDVYLIKTNSIGDTLWSRTYGGNSDDRCRSVQQTADGCYIVAGYTGSFGAGFQDVYLIKTDPNGDTLWSRTYGGGSSDMGQSVQQTTDGGYIIAGYTWSFGLGSYDVYLIKTNANGDTLWTRTYGTFEDDQGFSVQQTTDGGYIVTGVTGDYQYDEEDVYLIKTDSNGDTLWSRTYGGSFNDGGRSVQQTPDGGYIVAGYAISSDELDRFYLIKTNSTGDPLWSRRYGPYSGWSWSGQRTKDGGYVMAGYGYSQGAPDQDAFVIKTNSNGDILWTRTYGGGDDDWVLSVQQTLDGGYIVAEYVGPFKGNGDVMLTKLDSLGNTCIGEFISNTVMSEPCSVTSPATEVTYPPTVVTSPATEVTSPPTEDSIICMLQRGDANGSGSVDLADAVYIVNWLFIGGPAPDPLWLGDANCSGSVDLADAVYIVNWLFIGGPPPGC